MAGDWICRKIVDVFEVNPDRSIRRGEITPYIPMDALMENVRSPIRVDSREFTGTGARFRNGDTLIARITPCLENGKTAYVNVLQPGVLAHGSTEYVVLSGKKEESDNLFAYYVARSPRFREYAISNMEGTSGRQRVPTVAIENYALQLPGYLEQVEISSILGLLDEKIELNRKISEKLEALSQAIFRSWFINFEPAKAKISSAASFPSMPQAIFEKIPEIFDESEIGLVPKGWSVKPIVELVEVNPSRSLRKNEVVPHLDMKSMPTDGHYPGQLIMRPFGSGAKFTNGDTLVARITPCLENGKTAFVNFLNEDQVAWGSTEYIVLRPYEPIPPVFAYLLARTEEFRQFSIQSMTGTSGRQRVPFSALSHFLIAEPPSYVLEAFGDLVNPMIERSTAAYVESKKLAEIRDYLLPRLLSGDLQVSKETVE